MKKLVIGQTIGEVFRLFFRSLFDLFKNNWLLIILLIGANWLMLIDVYSNKDLFLSGGTLKANESAFSDLSATYWITSIITALLGYMFYGYVVRYVNTEEKNGIGLGGVYIKMPLIKMLVSVLLAGIVMSLILIPIVVGAVAIAGLLGASSLSPNTKGLLEASGITIAVIFYCYIILRFITVGAYSFLHNEVAVFRPFHQTKSNAMRILVINICVTLVGLIIFIPLGILCGVAGIMFPPVAFFLASLSLILWGYLQCVTFAVIYKNLNSEEVMAPAAIAAVTPAPAKAKAKKPVKGKSE